MELNVFMYIFQMPVLTYYLVLELLITWHLVSHKTNVYNSNTLYRLIYFVSVYVMCARVRRSNGCFDDRGKLKRKKVVFSLTPSLRRSSLIQAGVGVLVQLNVKFAFSNHFS